MNHPHWLRTLSVALLLALILGLAGVGPVLAQDGGERPFLGVSIQNMPEGALVAEVMPDSPADEAGVRVGDLITALDGEAVTLDSPLGTLMLAHAPGDEIALTIQRGDETINLPVTLGTFPEDLPEPEEAQPEETVPEVVGRVMILGGAHFLMNPDHWVVLEVEAGRPADGALEPGDMVTNFDGRPVDEWRIGQLASRIVEGGEFELEVVRDDEAITATLELRPGASIVVLEAGVVPSPPQPVPAEPAEPVQPIPVIPGGAAGDERGFLGVMFQIITPEAVEALDLPVDEGALIVEVLGGFPAEEAGLEPGDIVTAVNGEPVNAEITLADRLYAYEVDDTVTLTVLRGDETLEVEATLAARPPEVGAISIESGEPSVSVVPGQPQTFVLPAVPGGPMAGGQLPFAGGVTINGPIYIFVTPDGVHMVPFGMFGSEGMPFGMFGEGGNMMPFGMFGQGFMAAHPALRALMEAMRDPDFDWDEYMAAHPELEALLEEMGSEFDWEEWLDILPEFPWFGQYDPFHEDVQPGEPALPGPEA